MRDRSRTLLIVAVVAIGKTPPLEIARTEKSLCRQAAGRNAEPTKRCASASQRHSSRTFRRVLIDAAATPVPQDDPERTRPARARSTSSPDYAVLADEMKNGKLDLAVFHGFEYAWVKHIPNLLPHRHHEPQLR